MVTDNIEEKSVFTQVKEFGGKPLCTCWASNIHFKVLLVNITGNTWVLLAVPVLVKTCTGGCKYEFA